jgi:aconitate decarboxylase
MPDAPPAAPVSHDLASWLAAVQLDDVPAATQTRAKHLLLDGIGCALVGARLPWSDAATDALTTLEGSGPTALIGTGRATTPLAAALLNSSYIQGFELDDYHPIAPVHGASLVIPAMLSTLPIAPSATGTDLLLGAIRGFEVGPRVGHALHGAQMLTRGWHSGPVFGGPAAAAAAGTLMQLDENQFEDAIGLAATQACGLMAAQFESMGKRMQHGFAARNGLLAATLAAGGYTGIKQVFERPYGGFLATFGEGHDPDPSQITDGLGERWETDVIAVKPYAAMAGLHAAIDAARAMLADGPVDPRAVDSITVSVSEPAFHHGGWRAERPLAAVGAQMNLAYAVAVTLLDGTALAAQFAPARTDADDVWALIERTTLRHEPAFDARFEDGYNTRLEVALSDGEQRTSFVDMPRGGLLKPLTNDEVLEKFRTVTEPLIDTQRAREIESMVLALEQLNDAAELVERLAPPVDPIFADPEVPA